MPIDVYLADDHPAIRDSVGRAIRARDGLEMIGEAEDGRTALREIRMLCPHVAVLDVGMPLLGGMEVLEALHGEDATTRVVLLTGSVEGEAAHRAFGAGAVGFVSKTAGPTQICDAIETVMRGETFLSPEFQGGLVREIHSRRTDNGPMLSQREREVLEFTAAGASAGEIGARLHLSAATVRTHLQHLYGKLGVHDRAAAVAEALRRGIID